LTVYVNESFRLSTDYRVIPSKDEVYTALMGLFTANKLDICMGKLIVEPEVA
jgi:hypothetical protein